MDELTPEEQRVLGCLLEKALATPQQYPLSESALLAACNQTTNRDPVVSYEIDVVRRALISLREQNLARTVHRPGERSAKHRHLADEALDLDAAEQAVLAVLLLRGPQTVGELRTRTERLHAFAHLPAVEAVLDELDARGLVGRLERAPGQKEGRVRHLLGEPGEEQMPSAAAIVAPREDLRAEVRALRAELDALRATVEELAAKVDGR
jgi:uncharacterized protein YceH (UPF0502 family)